MEPTPSRNDEALLRRAVELGRRGWGRVHPNPMVGCVIVRDGEIVAEAWHEELGGAHAEALALARAGERARGATAYVSLEPCNHHGRTPPCAQALLDAGIARVVFGATDPGPRSSGGAGTLQSGGVEVLGPLLSAQEARRENPAFFCNQEEGRSYVALKLAQSLDGRIAEAPGRRTAITGSEARRETHRLRAGFDAVMVGSETVLVDDPLLTVRENVPCRTQPTRIVLDGRGRVAPEARIFQGLSEAALIIFTGEDAAPESVRRMEGAGARVHRVPRSLEGVSMEAVLATCWEEGIRSLFCEGGSRVASQLIRQGLARRLYLFLAPFVLGGEGVSAFTGLEPRDAWEPWITGAPPRLFGRDVLLTFDWTG